MAKEIIQPRGISKPVGPYSQGVVTTGRKLIFISGQVAQDAQGNLVGKGDIEAQTKQVLTNLKTMVEAAGGTVADITKITVFMVEVTPSAYEVVSRLRHEFFDGEYPASTLVGVKSLAVPEWLIEIEAWAVV